MNKFLTFILGFCICIPLVSYIVTDRDDKSGFTMVQEFGKLISTESDNLKNGFNNMVDSLSSLIDLDSKSDLTGIGWLDDILFYIATPVRFIGTLTEFTYNVGSSLFGIIYGTLKLVFA